MNMWPLLWSALAGLFLGLLGNFLTHKLDLANRKTLPWLFGLSAAAAVFLVLQLLSSTPPRTVAPETQQGEPSFGGAVAPSPSGTSSTPTLSTSSPPPVMATSLLDLPAVQQDVNDSIDLDRLGTTAINGASYGRAVAYSCDIYCNGTSPQVIEVTLGKQFKKFVATAAVLDTNVGEYRFDITLDQRAPVKFTTSPGHPASINLNVEGVSRLRIELFAPGALKSPLQAGADSPVGKNGSGLPGVALADPMVLP